MDDTNKVYYVRIQDEKDGQAWSAEKLNRNRGQLLSQYPTVEISEFTDYDRDAGVSPADKYYVKLPDEPEGQMWDGEKFGRNKEALYKRYPKVEVKRYGAQSNKPLPRTREDSLAVFDYQTRGLRSQYEDAVRWSQDASIPDDEREKYASFVQRHQEDYDRMNAERARLAGVSPETPAAEKEYPDFYGAMKDNYDYYRENADRLADRVKQRREAASAVSSEDDASGKEEAEQMRSWRQAKREYDEKTNPASVLTHIYEDARSRREALGPGIPVESVKGYLPSLRQSGNALGYNLDYLAMSAVEARLKPYLGSTSDSKAALDELDRREKEGLPADTRYVNRSRAEMEALLATLDGIPEEEKQKIRDSFAERIKRDDIANAVHEKARTGFKGSVRDLMNKNRDVDAAINKAIEDAGGDVEAARVQLSGRAATPLWYEREMARAAKGIEANSLPTEGFAAWLGEMTPLIAPSLAAAGLSAVTGSPLPAQIAGKLMGGTFAASSAGSAMYQARQYGATDTQAWAAGLSSAVIMYLTTQVPFNKFTEGVLKGQSAELTRAFENAISQKGSIAEKELEMLFKEAKKRVGGELLSKQTLRSVMANAGASSASFASMNALETMVPILYKNPEDYPALTEVIKNGLHGAADGALMGAIMGSAGAYASWKQNLRRWDANGALMFAELENPEGGMYVAEVIGANGKRITPAGFREVKMTREIQEPVTYEDGTPYMVDGKQQYRTRKVEVPVVDEAGNPVLESGRASGMKTYAAVEDDSPLSRYGREWDRSGSLASRPGTAVDPMVTLLVDGKQVEMSLPDFAKRVRGMGQIDSENARLVADNYRETMAYEEGRQKITGGRPDDNGVNRGVAETKAAREASNGGLSPDTAGDLNVVNAERQGKKDALREVIQQRTGQQFWQVTGGEDTVQVITLEDGTRAFIVGEAEGKFAYVDENGRKGTLDAGEGVIQSLDSFLQAELDAMDAQGEQQRIAAEYAENLRAVQQRVGAEMHVPVGTPEAEQMGTVMQVTDEGVIVHVEGEPQPRTMSWQQVADAFSMPLMPKTREQIISERLEADEKAQQYNDIIPQDADLQVQYEGDEAPSTYKFRGAEVEDGQIVIKAQDPDSGEVVDLLPEMIGNLDAIVNTTKRENGSSGGLMQGDASPLTSTTTPDNSVLSGKDTNNISNTFDDQAANQLGIPADYLYTTKKGRKVVNSEQLWKDNPQLWAQWNDLNENRDMPTMDFIAARLKDATNEVNKYRTSLENAVKAGRDEDTKEDIRDRIAEKTARQQVVQELYDKYVEAQKAAEEAAKAAVEAEKAAQKAAAEAERRAARREEADLGEPQTLEELVANGMRSVQHQLNREDFQRETGWSDTELNKFFPWWAKKGQGLTLKELAEQIAYDEAQTGLVPQDMNADQPDVRAVRDAIIDILRGAAKPSDITNYTRNANLERRAQMEREAEAAARAAQEEEQGDNMPAGNAAVAEIAAAREQVDTNPTEAQKEAGNYKKGHITLDGYDITLENPKGSTRSGVDASGKEWSQVMNNDYGYIRMTEGVDGDHIDVFLSDNPTEGNVFVVDQVDPQTGKFDEHKVMYGFTSADEARDAYLSNYEPGWKGLGKITEVSKDDFKKWIESSHRKTKPFAEYKSVKPVGVQGEVPGEEAAAAAPTPLENVLEMLGTNPRQAAIDIARTKLREIAGRLNADLPRTSVVEIMREKAGVLQQMFDRIGMQDTFASTYEDILGLFKRNGASWRDLEQVEEALDRVEKKRTSVQGFHSHGKCYVLADDLASVDEAIEVWEHEDGHRFNLMTGAVDAMRDTVGDNEQTLAEIRTAVHNFQNTDFYDNKPWAEVADEILAIGRNVLQREGPWDMQDSLERIGLHNENLINFVIDNAIKGKEYAESIIESRRASFVDDAPRGNNLQNERAPQGRTREVGRQGLRPAGRSGSPAEEKEGKPGFSTREVSFPSSVTPEQRESISNTLKDYTNPDQYGKARDICNEVGEQFQEEYDAKYGNNRREIEEIAKELSMLGRRRGDLYRTDKNSEAFKDVVERIKNLNARKNEIEKGIPSIKSFSKEIQSRKDKALKDAGFLDNANWRQVAVAPTFDTEIEKELRALGWDGKDNGIYATEYGFVSHHAAHHDDMSAVEVSKDMLRNLYEPNAVGFVKGHDKGLAFIRKGADNIWYTTIIGANRITNNGGLVFLTTYKNGAKENPVEKLSRVLTLSYPSSAAASGRMSLDFDNHGAKVSKKSELASKYSKKEAQTLKTQDILGSPKVEEVSELGPDTHEGTVLFSVKDDKGKKTLVGIHNIEEDKLMKALLMGGLANPSSAVIDISFQDHFGYGDVSLVMPSSLVDAKTGRNAGTFDRDAWTPRYPQIEYISTPKSRENVKALVADVPELLKNHIPYCISQYLDGNIYHSGLEYVFLKEKGEAPEVQIVARRYPHLTPELIFEKLGLPADTDPNDSNTILDAYEGLSDEHRREFNIFYYADGDPAYIALRNEISEHGSKFRRLMESRYRESIGFGSLDQFIHKAIRDVRDAGKESPELTIAKAVDAIRDKHYEREFSVWQTQVIEGLGYKEVFDAGNGRHLPNTLENVSKWMKRQGTNASKDHAKTGSGIFEAKLAQKFINLAQIRANKSRLVDFGNEDEMNIAKRIHDAIGTFMDFGNGEGMYSQELVAQECVEDIVLRGRDVDEVVERYNEDAHTKISLSEEEKEELRSLHDAVKNAPAFYFETKFERPVALNEFAAAVVPNNTAESLKSALRDNGLPVFEYESGVDGSRREATLKASEADGIRFSFIGERGAGILDAASEAPTRLADLEAARRMEEAGTEPRMIKMLTNWERGADKKWRYELNDNWKFDPSGNVAYRKRNPDFARWEELMKKRNMHAFYPETHPDLAAEENAEFEKLNLIYSHPASAYKDWRNPHHNSSRVKDYIDAPELFAAYPGVRNVEIKWEDMEPGHFGSMNYRDNVIKLDKGVRLSSGGERARSALVHEVQHWIQETEGFAGGTSLAAAERTAQQMSYDPLTPYQRKFMNDVQAFLDMKAYFDAKGVLLTENLRSWMMGSAGDYDPDFAGDYILNSSAEDIMKEYERLREKDKRRMVMTGLDVYRRTAGEVEARNVQRRLDTPLSNRRTLAEDTEDVARKDQIIRFTDWGFSRGGLVTPEFVRAQSAQKVPGMDYTDGEADGVRFSLSNNNRKTVSNWLGKRKDLTDEQRMAVIDYLDAMNNPRLQLATAKWFAQGVIRLPEDMYKVEQAVSVAGKAKVDPLQYPSPMALMEVHAGIKPSEKRIDPDTVSTLHKVKEISDYGITIYDVDEGEQSRKNMREIINTHFGREASPWCLLRGDGNGNLSRDSKKYWDGYNAYPKQVAFRNGKLFAFSANDSEKCLWWDRQDKPYEGFPIEKEIPGDELKRRAIYVLNPENGKLNMSGNKSRGNKQNGTYEEWNEWDNLIARFNYRDGRRFGLQENFYSGGEPCIRETIGERGENLGDYTVWYTNGKLKNEWHFNENGRADGVQRSYHANGQMHESRPMVDGKKEGVVQMWADNGQLVVRQEYVDDKRNGLEQTWNERGVPETEINYRDGLRDGLSRVYIRGQLIREATYKKDMVVGEQKSWYQSGNIKSILHFDDEGFLHGEQLEYHDFVGREEVASRKYYNHGELDGPSDEWYDKDKPSLHETWADGKRVGLYEEWYPNGVLKWRRNYNDSGELDGVSEQYTAGGSLFERYIYEDGHIVSYRTGREVALEAEEEGGVSFSIVSDKDEIERLEKIPTTTLYRAMELIDGTLYPPMSQKIPNAKGAKGGKLQRRQGAQLGQWEKADEDPAKAYRKKPDGPWYYDLKKIKGSDVNGVLYNPYLHLSASPLNDQFSAASQRPNLVTVACEVPITELSSRYKAEKANDSVGPKDWHSGTVTAQLGEGRQVVLSRWAKPVRIVPDSEVASLVAPKLVAKGIIVPENVVTPSLKAALERKGVKFSHTFTAPNGQPSNLDEARYNLVRTKEFKDFFGDWENVQTVQQIKNLKAEDLIPMPAGETSEDVYKGLRNGINKNDKTEVKFFVSAYNKVTKLGGISKEIIATLPNIFDNSILAYTEKDNRGGKKRPDGTTHKSHPNIEEVRNYIGKVRVGDKDYYVRFTVNVQKNNTGVHSYFATDIDLYETNSATSLSDSNLLGARVTDSGIVDTKLENFFNNANNSSKVVDENGEPLVMYHGTDQDFYTFRSSRRGIWFAGTERRAAGYAAAKGGERVIPVFLNIRKPAPSEYPNAEQGDWRRFNELGYDGWISYNDDGSIFTAVVANPNQIKSADATTYDDNGKEIPVSERFNADNDDIRFSIANQTQNGFISNAEASLDRIKMDKATPEQWLKMLEKEGGLKAGEDKWLGLSDWIKSSRKQSLTKQEVADFIAENRIQIEEVHYGESEAEVNAALSRFQAEFDNLLNNKDVLYAEADRLVENFYNEMRTKYGATYLDDMNSSERTVEEVLLKERDNREEADNDELAFGMMTDKYGEDFRSAFYYDDGKLEIQRDYDGKISGAARMILGLKGEPINSMRLRYATEGLDNNREIALTIPTIEPYYGASPELHFADESTEGRTVAWIRFGDAEGIPSEVDEDRLYDYRKRKQQYEKERDNAQEKIDRGTTGRTREQAELDVIAANGKLDRLAADYSDVANIKTRMVLFIDEIQSQRHQEARNKGYIDKTQYRARRNEVTKNKGWDLFKGDTFLGFISDLIAPTEEEAIKHAEKYDMKRGIPAAPFEKNWHELAMKRMLRLAAEEGYDYVAWTTGEQQAARYRLGGVVKSLKKGNVRNNQFLVKIEFVNGAEQSFIAQNDGVISEFSGFTALRGKTLDEVFGKALAKRLVEMPEGETIEGEGLAIGGEGMIGFYDEILPRFMNKYGKKWGVKVEDINLPDLEESARVAHAVPVTQEMKESVMEGQPMFSLRDKANAGDVDQKPFQDRLDKSEDKEIVLNEYFRQIQSEDYPAILTMRDNFEHTLVQNGIPQKQAADLALVAKFGKGKSVNVGGKGFFIVEPIEGVEDARTLYVHERQHMDTLTMSDIERDVVKAFGWDGEGSMKPEDFDNESLVSIAVPAMKAALEKLTPNASRYYGKPLGDIAREILSYAQEVAYREENFVDKLKNDYLVPDKVVDIVKEFYERRNNVQREGLRGRPAGRVDGLGTDESRLGRTGEGEEGAPGDDRVASGPDAREREGEARAKDAVEVVDIVKGFYERRNEIPSNSRGGGRPSGSINDDEVFGTGDEASRRTPEGAPGNDNLATDGTSRGREEQRAKQSAVTNTASTLGVEVVFRPASEMTVNGRRLTGRWQDGKISVCLQNCRNADEAVRTVVHEAVGHEGLRKLVGAQNMREFGLALYRALPEDIRRDITDAAFGKRGGNIVDAVEEWLADKAEDVNFGEKSIWDTARAALRDLLRKVGVNVEFGERDVRWLLWQSYNANKEDDLMVQVRRQSLANSLGFSIRQQEDRAQAEFVTRNREAEEVSAARLYNMAVQAASARLNEVFVDKDDSVNRAVAAIEASSGKPAQDFEDIRLALNQQSSKGLAATEKFIREKYTPMMEAVKKIVKAADLSVEDIERYVKIKHGIERNEVFAKRDARNYYRALADKEIKRIKDSDAEDEVKDSLIEREKTKLDKRLEKIDRQTDPKYRELREKDYGGLTAMYSEFKDVAPYQEGVESYEEYQRRVLAARKSMYETLAETEEAAAKEMRSFEESVGSGLTDELWKTINAATRSTLLQQYKSNMMSRRQYETVRDMFKFYVPLRGFKDNTAADMYDYYMSDNSGEFTPPLLKAGGRKTESESPFGYIGSMASSAITEGVKNETKLSLYYFVTNRPDNDLMSAGEVWYENTGMTEDGRRIFEAVYPPLSEELSAESARKAFVEWENGMKEKARHGFAYKGAKHIDLNDSVIHISESEKNEHVIKFKINGEERMIFINGNPRAAQAVNNMLNVNAAPSELVSALQKVLRYVAMVNTQLNPEFWMTNLQRDLLFATMSESAKGDKEFNRSFRRNLHAARRVLKMKKAYEAGTLGDSQEEQYYREFVEGGGVTGYSRVIGTEEWEREVRKFNKDERKAIAAVTDAFNAIGDFGDAVEQMTRFAAYKTSREAGKGIIDAVADAKELTVNFNRKGSGIAVTFKEAAKLRDKNGKPLSKFQQAAVVAASTLGAYGRSSIVFFNAAVQGLNNMVNLYKRNRKAMLIWTAGYFALGVLNAALHAMLDDDDDDYLDMPADERGNNLCLGWKGVYFKWALPQEARVFYRAGDVMVNHALGRTPNKTVAGEMLSAVGEVSPIDFASGVSALAPSVATPIVEIIRNEDWTGGRVYNERRFLSKEEREHRPKYRDPLKNTPDIYVDISEALNFISGGNEYEGGAVNWDPNIIEHLVEGYTGGAGTSVEKLFVFLGNAAQGQFTVRDTPFLRRLLSISDERYRNAHVSDLYYYYKGEAENTRRIYKEALKAGDEKRLKKLEESDDLKIMQIYESYKSAMKTLDDDLKAVPEENKEEKKEIMRRQDAMRKEMIREISEIK